MTSQADADPVAVVLAAAAAAAASVGLAGATSVSGVVEPPWPHVVVANGQNGDLRDGLWSAEHEVELEVIGDPTGAPGKAALWATAMRLTAALVALPDTQNPGAGDPVVSKVRPSGVWAWAPMSNGQPRYVIGVYVTLRPPLT